MSDTVNFLHNPALVHSLKMETERIKNMLEHFASTRSMHSHDDSEIKMWRKTFYTRIDELYNMMNLQTPDSGYPKSIISHQPIHITEPGKEDRLLVEFDSRYRRQYV